MKLLGIGLLLFPALAAQTLQVYSELQRVDPFGHVVPVDRRAHPREILSPAVARNGFFSFHVAVTSRPNTSYFLYTQTYPPNAFRITVYKENFVRSGESWIPDPLEEIQLPAFAAMPDASAKIEGQTTRIYLVDVWVPRETPIGRVRLEVLIKAGYWMVSPMEVRIPGPTVPDLPPAGPIVKAPRVEDRADSAVFEPLTDYLDGAPVGSPPRPVTVRHIIRRNAMQDMALARLVERQLFGFNLRRRLLDSVFDAWGTNPYLPRQHGPEWYLTVRDLLLR